MRVRTVIDILGCHSYMVTDESLLDRDVVVRTTDTPLRDAESVLSLARFGGESTWRDRTRSEGILLVHAPVVDGESLDDLRRPPMGVVFVASRQTYDEFLDSYRRLPEQCALLSLCRMKMHKAFLLSYDVQQFASKIQPIFGNPLIITNSDHRLLATAGEIPEEREDVNEVVNSGYISDSVNAALDEDGHIRDARIHRHAVPTVSPRHGTRWAHSIVYVHDMEMGRFDVLENNKPITPLDLELIDFATTLVGVMIERLGVAGDGVGAGSSVLHDLVRGSFVNEETMRSQLALTLLPLDETYAMIAIVGQRGAVAGYYTRVGRLVSGVVRNCLWTVEDNVLAVLVPLGRGEAVGYDGYDRTRKALLHNRRLRTLLDNYDMHAYVSEPFMTLGMVAGRYTQCISLMNAIDREKGTRIHLFWEERYTVMTNNAKTFGQVDSMIDKRVVALRMYDRAHGTQYFDTAIMSVGHPGSPAEAAEALNVHRNTYFYRINKVRELFYIDLKDGEDRLALAFSARILDVLGDRHYLDTSDYGDR